MEEGGQEPQICLYLPKQSNLVDVTKRGRQVWLG